MKRYLILALLCGLLIGCSDKFYEMRKSPCACLTDPIAPIEKQMPEIQRG